MSPGSETKSRSHLWGQALVAERITRVVYKQIDSIPKNRINFHAAFVFDRLALEAKVFPRWLRPPIAMLVTPPNKS